MTEWQDISTLKMDGRLVLMVSAGGDIYIAPAEELREISREDRIQLAKDGHWPDHKRWRRTHWMPLPAPPEES